MDAVSHLIRLARLDASLDKRCLLGHSTKMNVTGYGQREAPFHVLLQGSCTLEVGAHRHALEAGVVVLIRSGASHRVITPGEHPLESIAESAGDAFTTTRSASGGSAVIDLFCGHYTFGPGAGAMLFRSLPDPVHVSFGKAADSEEVLRTLGSLMREEAGREGAGTAAILSALCTVMLAMVMRTSLGSATATAMWTAAADARIAVVIEEVLEHPGDEWSIERMSRVAAMSRATFMRHFRRGTGMSVGAFVARARLMTAAELLISEEATVASVALRVGYRSESAFSRSFRSAVGVTPARFRRESQLPPALMKQDHASVVPSDDEH
jgi:AraC family transcriptional activator of mtrCDE